MTERRRIITSFTVAVLLAFAAIQPLGCGRSDQRPTAETCVLTTQETDLTRLKPPYPIGSLSVCEMLIKSYEIARTLQCLIFQVLRIIYEAARE